MAPRLELQQLLITILGSGNVYFQPPADLIMQYPCIVYERDYIQINHANDKPYKHAKRYLITIIDRNPDSVIPDQIAKLPLCAFDRHFVTDNLNHDVYRLFF